MKLVMVHGRAQQGKDPVALQHEWVGALERGLGRKLISCPREQRIDEIFGGGKGGQDGGEQQKNCKYAFELRHGHSPLPMLQSGRGPGKSDATATRSGPF